VSSRLHSSQEVAPPTARAVAVNKVLESAVVQIYMLFLTVAILYAGDLVQATADVSYDIVIYLLLWVCLICFSIEWVANVVASAAQTPRYNCSLFFYLDFVATISIAIDIIVLEANDFSKSGPVARAARAARIGTRAGRSIRLMRLMRFLRLVRITRMVKALLARRIRRIGSSRLEPEEQIVSDMTRADTIGAQIGAATTKKVIIMTLMLLTMISLLERSTEFQTCSGEVVFSTQAIYNTKRIGRNCTRMQQEVGAWFTKPGGIVSFSQTSDQGLSMNGLIYASIEGCLLYVDWDLHGPVDDPTLRYLAERRRGTEIQVVPCDAQFTDTDPDGIDIRSPTFFLYDMRKESIEEGAYSMGFTTVIIVSLLGFSLIFSQDAEGIANQLVVPMRQLMMDMSHTAKLELHKVTPPEEVVQSSVFEVRSLQVAFLNLNIAVKSFSKFTPLEVVRHFLSLGAVAQLGVVERNVSIFFSDIAGWTTICEKTSPADVLKLLSEYFEGMVSVIIEEKGTMLEFIGDAILAIWNAPNDVPDHAARAVSSAVRMDGVLQQLRQDWQASGRPEIRIRVGLHSARVYVGNLGSNMRMKYGVLGDGVNLASRLEELNKRYKTECMISEDVLEEPQVADLFHVRPLDLVCVKGRARPSRIYQVMGSRGAPDADPDMAAIESLSQQAFGAYVEQRFQAAIGHLQKIAQLKGGEDEPGKVLLQRCEEYLKSPPPPNWDGTEVGATDD